MTATSKNDKSTFGQDMMTLVQKQILAFLDFASMTLDSDGFRVEMEALMPFDQLLIDRIGFVNDMSPIRSMGIVIMKMEAEPAKYALGVDVALSDIHSPENCPTRFIAAAKTHEELWDFVKDKAFSLQVEDFVMEQIKQHVESK